MNDTPKVFANALPAGTELLWYKLGHVIGQGAFGITYLAEDTNLGRLVAVKEYLPGQLATRDASQTVEPLSDDLADEYGTGLRRFVTEARTLAKFEHPNIVRVHNVFEHNNTAYMVMQYEDGRSLGEILRTRGTLRADELPPLLFPLLDGLEAIHAAGFIHRDVKPGNVFVRSDGSPVLLDFGSARESLEEQTRTLTNFVSPGYAPIEQYTSKSNSQGPWTDIYGLAATLYRVLGGTAPSNAIERGQEIAQDGEDGYVPARVGLADKADPALLAAIDHGLAFNAKDRPATIAAWRAELEGAFTEDEVPTSHPPSAATGPVAQVRTVPAPSPGTRPAARHPAYGPVALALAAVMLVAFGAWWWHYEGAPPDTRLSTAVEQAAPAATADAPAALEALSGADAREEPVAAPPAAADPVPGLLGGAAEDLAALRLTTPAGNNAYEKYQQVLALEPEHAAARRGIEAIASRYVQLAYAAMDKDKREQAAGYLDKAETLGANPATLGEARASLAALDESEAVDGADGQKATLADKAEALGKRFGDFVREQQDKQPQRSRGDAFLQKFGN